MIRFTFAASLAVAATACGSTNAPNLGTAIPTGIPSFERTVNAFEVRSADGVPYDHPLLGGLNIPRPQLVDIDGDGDLDLFVQEYTDRLIFFEQTGTPENPKYVWRTDAFHDLAVGEWYRFGDIDGDGDHDLLAEMPFSYVRYYRNDGTIHAPLFVVGADSLKDVNGTPIFSDRQNIPNVTDIDCDGLLDLMIGRLTGTITRYEEATRDDGGVPHFRLLVDRFEDIEIVAQIGSLHGANTMAITDIDDDGDEDLFWGDFFEPGVLFIENTGSCGNPVLRSEPAPFPRNDPLLTSGYNAPAFGDIDADGDLDVLVGVLGGAFNPNRTTIDNLHFLRNVDDGFEAVTARYVTSVDAGSESIASFVDLDGDGDLDLWLSNKIDPTNLKTSLIYEFENVGDARRPDFVLRGPLDFTGSYHYAPAFADLDNDGDLDLLMGTWRDELMFYRNDGSREAPNFVLADSALVEITRGSNATPTLVDIDADDDFDLFVGEASGTINFYLNVGSPEAARYELVSDEYADIDIGRRSFPTFVDLDRDGDQDMVVGTEAGGAVYFRNDGTPNDPIFVPDDGFGPVAPPFTTPSFADIDGDGDADFFTGGIGGGIILHLNQRIRD